MNGFTALSNIYDRGILSSKFHFYSLREKCPYLEFFWSVFSYIRTEYGEILHASPYLAWIRENTNQKNSEYGHFSRSALSKFTGIN